MTEEIPPPDQAPDACNCGGGDEAPTRKRQHGPKKRSACPEWREPVTVAMIQSLGKRVRWLRTMLQLDRETLSEMSKVSEKSIGDVEKGQPKDVAYLIPLAHAMGCPFYRLWLPQEKWDRYVAKNLHVFEAMRARTNPLP